MEMKLKQYLEMILIATTLIGVGAGASWAIRGNQIEDAKNEINALQTVNKLNYPNFLLKINNANKLLVSHLSDLESVKELKEKGEKLLLENKKLKETNKNILDKHFKKLSEYTHRIKVYDDEVTTLKLKLQKLTAKSTFFELKEHNGISLKKGQLQIGYNRTTNGDCQITINNKKHVLQAGNYIEENIDTAKCKIILNECPESSYSNVNLQLICP